jgi:hypothetical protein
LFSDTLSGLFSLYFGLNTSNHVNTAIYFFLITHITFFSFSLVLFCSMLIQDFLDGGKAEVRKQCQLYFAINEVTRSHFILLTFSLCIMHYSR